MPIVKIQRPIESGNENFYAINLDIALIHDNIKFQNPNAKEK